jgi:hypothetical protein
MSPLSELIGDFGSSTRGDGGSMPASHRSSPARTPAAETLAVHPFAVTRDSLLPLPSLPPWALAGHLPGILGPPRWVDSRRETLVVNPRFAGLVPPPAPAEVASIRESILADGIQDFLFVRAGTNEILDGHHRWPLARAHGVPAGATEPHRTGCLRRGRWSSRGHRIRPNAAADAGVPCSDRNHRSLFRRRGLVAGAPIVAGSADEPSSLPWPAQASSNLEGGAP